MNGSCQFGASSELRRRRKWFAWVFAPIVAWFISIGPAQAAAILYFKDLSLGTDRMGQALSSPAITGSHTVTTASSLADFTTKLNTGNFQLAIFFEQNDSGAGYDAAFAAIAAHLSKGGAAIADDWTQNTTHSAAFGVTFPAGNNNQTSFNVIAPALLPGVTNPVNLTNPGWGTFSYDMTGSGTTSIGASFPVGGSAIIIGNNGRSIFNGFLSDTFVDGTEGVNLYVNEINLALASLPEPGTVALFAVFGAVGYVRYRRRQRTA